jgi:N-acetylglucosaminyldiphosphoundecaprenol N-acetyl-beta-D-mannosaminyltransferase
MLFLRKQQKVLPVRRLRIGEIAIDVIGFEEAVSAIIELAKSGRGGYVVTPNIDHVVLAENNEEFRAAYAGAALSLVDGMPLLWASRLLKVPLPEKISGADLIEPGMKRAAEEGLRVYLLGAGPGVAEKAGLELHHRFGVNIVGCDAPMLSASPGDAETAAALKKVRDARPHVVLVAMGAPKQEILMHRFEKEYAPAVALGIGAGLDFIAGTLQRAPQWMSSSGLEWAYRLSREPRRLWRRYLVNDPQFMLILAKTMARSPEERVAWR